MEKSFWISMLRGCVARQQECVCSHMVVLSLYTYIYRWGRRRHHPPHWISSACQRQSRANELTLPLNGAGEMEFVSQNVGEDDEHWTVHYVPVSRIFATHDDFFLWNPICCKYHEGRLSHRAGHYVEMDMITFRWKWECRAGCCNSSIWLTFSPTRCIF